MGIDLLTSEKKSGGKYQNLTEYFSHSEILQSITFLGSQTHLFLFMWVF